MSPVLCYDSTNNAIDGKRIPLGKIEQHMEMVRISWSLGGILTIMQRSSWWMRPCTRYEFS